VSPSLISTVMVLLPLSRTLMMLRPSLPFMSDGPVAMVNWPSYCMDTAEALRVRYVVRAEGKGV